MGDILTFECWGWLYDYKALRLGDASRPESLLGVHFHWGIRRVVQKVRESFVEGSAYSGLLEGSWVKPKTRKKGGPPLPATFNNVRGQVPHSTPGRPRVVGGSRPTKTSA